MDGHRSYLVPRYSAYCHGATNLFPPADFLLLVLIALFRQRRVAGSGGFPEYGELEVPNGQPC